ncbi:MAG: GTP-binding protein [Rhodobacteraceae bacterium]|nr:GTP-binding protein [Paracoccaceae bacterium]
MSGAVPVTIIGGYLGAGKTTLVNHLLRHAGGQRLAVLVNEFGELAIDQDLIEAEGDEIISIAGGCICCSFGDDLSGALTDLAALSPPPDHIVIEASGVAIPGSVAASVSLLAGFRPGAIAVLADAETVRDHARDVYLGDTILRQLHDADMVIMTKTDLLDRQAVLQVRDWLGATAGDAEIFEAPHGRLPGDVLLGPGASGCGHGPAHHHDASFESAAIAVDGPVEAHGLAARLADGELGVIRAKGFVEDVCGATRLIQVVGRRFEVLDSPARDRHILVCIGRSGGLRRAELRRLIQTGRTVP